MVLGIEGRFEEMRLRVERVVGVGGVGGCFLEGARCN